MPKSKKTKLVKSPIIEREQKSKKKEKVERKAVSKYNNSQQVKEVITLATENNETNITKDFLIIAGSYERILYGIDAHWIKGESSDNVCIFRIFKFYFFF